MKEHLTTAFAAIVPAQRVALGAIDVIALVELVVVVLVAVTNWFYKRRKDKADNK